MHLHKSNDLAAAHDLHNAAVAQADDLPDSTVAHATCAGSPDRLVALGSRCRVLHRDSPERPCVVGHKVQCRKLDKHLQGV